MGMWSSDPRPLGSGELPPGGTCSPGADGHWVLLPKAVPSLSGTMCWLSVCRESSGPALPRVHSEDVQAWVQLRGDITIPKLEGNVTVLISQ